MISLVERLSLRVDQKVKNAKMKGCGAWFWGLWGFRGCEGGVP